jgi:hypothetical protein
MTRFEATAFALGVLIMTSPLRAIESAEVKARFADPPVDFSTAPLWVFNDDVTPEQVVDTLRDLAGQNVKQVFLHPRPGLMTPYLDEPWFGLWQVALDEAARLDMNVWIYDENSYPSGFAGGHVPEAMPESRGRGVALQAVDKLPAPSDDILAAYVRNGDQCTHITDAWRRGEPAPAGAYFVARRLEAPAKPWHGGRTYVDLLYPGVTEKFLEITLEPYRKRFGQEFGKRVPGVFTDEPELRPAGGLPWTPDLPEQFEQRWGYALLDHLPSLVMPVGDYRRVRHNYFQTLNDLFVERWAKPYSEYCAKYELEFTGHYWEHEWPRCLFVPDNMAMYAWHQRPAIDNLMNRYSTDLHAQFGNTRTVRELASVANQCNRARTLCEAYGAGGWDLRFEDMKRIGDWLYVLGVNTLDQHLSFISIRGTRKRDHPQSFSYHEPWWDDYHVSATYFARLTAAVSAGRTVNDVLVIEPTTTAWMYNTDKADDPHLAEIGKTFEALVRRLEAEQIEYDIGSENILSSMGRAEDDALVVGTCRYTIVVLPERTENLNAKTVELLDAFLQAGGDLLCSGEPPSRVDGRSSGRVAELAQSPNWKRVTTNELADSLSRHQVVRGLVIERAANDVGELYHLRREIDDGQILMLANTSIEHPARGTLTAEAAGIEQWNPETGDTCAVPFERDGNNVRADYDIPPCGSLLLFLSNTPCEPAAKPAPASTTAIAPTGEITIKRLDPNVLTLDYVDVTAGGETQTGVFAMRACDFVYQKYGLAGNPWNRAVQFEDELIRRTFPPDSGFAATYRFVIGEKVPAALHAVVERADLYTITCNGRPVAPEAGAWWLDKAFGRIDIREAAKVGDNTLTVTAKPLTMHHEIEAAYVIGDFALEPTDKGFAIVPEPAALKLGPWNEQGYPLYGHHVGYTQTFRVDPATGGRYRVVLPAWYGSVARVVVNGQTAGHIWHQPWYADVTDAIRPGDNEITVIVCGTLRNTLGPHHGNRPLGLCWPAMFDAAPQQGPPPGNTYSSVSYGLFEPFVLEQIRP